MARIMTRRKAIPKAIELLQCLPQTEEVVEVIQALKKYSSTPLDRWDVASVWNCTDSKLYCQEKRSKNRNGIMAGETGLPGNYFCTATDGFIFAIFTNGKRNLFRVYRQN